MSGRRRALLADRSTEAASTVRPRSVPERDAAPRSPDSEQRPLVGVSALSRRSRFVDEVHDAVTLLITDNMLRPGDPLPSEQALAEMFGVSKRVVREALRSLAAQGVVQTSQGKRAVVAEFSPRAIEAYLNFVQRLDPRSALELHELREIVEGAATVLAARRATDEDKAKAREALDAMSKCDDDIASYVEADLDFHIAIIDGAQNRFLSDVMRALSGVLISERKLGWQIRLEAGIAPQALTEHRALLEAVESGDENGARDAFAAHMATGRAYLQRNGS